MTALAPADVVTLGGFLAVLIGWGVVSSFRSAHEGSPTQMMRRRALAQAETLRAPAHAAGADSLLARPLGGGDGIRAAWTAMLVRVRDFGGPAGSRWLIAAAAAGGALAVAGVLLAGLSPWLLTAVAPAQAALAGALAYSLLRARFRRRFLDGFPEALDLVIRAVRAGVPVNQAIQTAGDELPAPVGRECKRMGDALHLGVDQSEVLSEASQRIGVPEFQFFVVCLELQRETGGPLTETLENLGGIIRARTEVRLKTRALTAEGRTTSKVIGMVPVFTMGGLYSFGGDYIDVLLHTQTGHHILALAAGMVVVGLAIISRMSRLEA